MAIQRMTKSVRILRSRFEESNDALSVVQLVEQLNKEMNKTTVYRILERMESDGFLHSFTGHDGLTWYAKCTGCTSESHKDVHPHFQCKECGKTECLDIEVTIPQTSGHKIESAELLLLGQCNQCSKA